MSETPETETRFARLRTLEAKDQIEWLRDSLREQIENCQKLIVRTNRLTAGLRREP